jgi:hypothetical protein
MTENILEMRNSFLNNKVPKLWKNVSYLSDKSLSSWLKNI